MKFTERLRELEKKATKGPWDFISGNQDGPSDKITWVGANETTGCDEEDDCHNQVCSFPNDSYGYASNFHENGEFIAATRNSLTTLLDIIDVQREALEYSAKFPNEIRAQEALARVKELEKKAMEEFK